MSQPVIAYFYSTHSVYAFIGATRLAKICAAHGCQLLHRPFDLSPVVESSGARPFKDRSSGHVAYYFGREIERWAAFRQVNLMSHRPTCHDNSLALSSGLVIAAEAEGHDVDALSYEMLRAHWQEDIDLANPDHLAPIARSVGLDPDPLLAQALTPAVQAVFDENTRAAKALSVFGSPTYILDGDMYYGQDRLELLEHALHAPFPAGTYTHSQKPGA
ncbi:MAG: 2-hydroxychromene-2-carboxylate isomerase [Pseudomonadota bacterium]